MELAPESASANPADAPLDLSRAVAAARRGFRRDTELLVAHLDDGALYVPLAQPVQDTPLGTRVEKDELTLRPHLVATDTQQAFVAVFTTEELLAEFAREVGWTTTEEGDLQYCTLPARAAFDLGSQLIQSEVCSALVINPSADDELLLHRHELDSLRQGTPLPLVGYVSELPLGSDETTLISELEAPPSAEFLNALDSCLKSLAGVAGYRLQQTFNRERDLEPHPTLTLITSGAGPVDTARLEQLFGGELSDKLPPPGYIDVVFEPADPSYATTKP
jgi:hypothetical protein